MAQASTASVPPAMDVVAPPVDKKSDGSLPAHAASAEGADLQDPLDKLVAEDQRDQQRNTEEKREAIEKPTHHAQAAKPKDTPKAAGIGMAVTATVIIVLGLAALATYAYLQTNS